MSIYYNEADLLPRLICNNPSQNTKVITELERCFERCDSFSLSIAFISDSGLASIKQTLKNLQKQNKKGRLVTSTYLGFNTPKVFKELLKLDNIEVRVFPRDGFHPKGYIFENSDDYKIIIGSSNLTQNALSVNQEWNICLTSFANQDITQRIAYEFEQQWSESIPLTQDWIKEYEKIYVEPVPRDTIKNNNKEIVPNEMQEEALSSLQDMRHRGKDKALLISATGTGKTFLSAFDVKQFNAKKMLFVVHRENIARKAMESFKQIIPNKTFGMYTGNKKELECDYVFSTIQTIGKYEHLHLIEKDEFDYIVVDEVHHAGAKMYNDLIKYFTPKFMLGMTATPERTDNIDIYNLFDYNIAYEIRLQQAMEYDLLCPFHYYGISDIEVDDEPLKDLDDFNRINGEARAEHIINAIDDYSYSGDKVHGLIFVSRKTEAQLLSDIFNQKGFRTIALTGEDSESKRAQAIERLEMQECEEALDYIFTVDIFNEGVDIPAINQVVMARPTESAIIFIQQLGRGLRKDDGKEYVTIIDIIGNYDKNFLIPIALSGDNTYNKDNLRKFLFDSNSEIKGASTISFDTISKERIYKAIDTANFSEISLIKESYNQLKMKIGRIPTLLDFEKYGSIDPLRIFDNNSLGSYHVFLKKYDKDYNIKFEDIKVQFLEYVSKKFASGKRIHELEAIKQTMIYKDKIFYHLKDILNKEYGIEYDDKITQTIINELTSNFLTGSAKTTYKDVMFIEKKNDDYAISNIFNNLLTDTDFYNELMEVIELGIYNYNIHYTDKYLDTDLCLYKKYTYEDVCRLLNWEKAEVALNIGGYKYDKYSNTYPVFINYEKADVQASINYEDHFEDESHIIAISKNNRTLESDDMKTIINADKNNTAIHLFVRKNKDDKTSKEFYYLGRISPYKDLTRIKMKDINTDAVEIPYELETSVREDIYSFIVD